MIDTILIPTDGSDEAAVAVDHGIELATRFTATVHILHVVDVRTMETAPDSDDARASGQELVDAIAEEARNQQLSVATAVRTGTPSDCILQYTSKHDIDLITMEHTVAPASSDISSAVSPRKSSGYQISRC